MGSPPSKTLRQRILAAFDGLRPSDTLTRDDLASLLQRAHTYISNATDHMQRDGELVNTSPAGRTARYRPAPTAPAGNTRHTIESMLLDLPDGATISVDTIAARVTIAHSTIHNHIGALINIGHVINTVTRNLPGRYRLTNAGRDAIEDRIEAEAHRNDGTGAPQPPLNIPPPRLWHHASTARATGDDLNPWAGVPLRAGALDAAALPSRGIKA